MRASKPNHAAGDCVFESTADQFLFQYRGRHFPGFVILNHQQLRELTVETLGSNGEARAFGLVDSDLEWQIELGKLNSGVEPDPCSLYFLARTTFVLVILARGQKSL